MQRTQGNLTFKKWLVFVTCISACPTTELGGCAGEGWPSPALGGHSWPLRTGIGFRAENPGDTATKSKTELRDAVWDVCSWSFCGSAGAELQVMGTSNSAGRIFWQSMLPQLFQTHVKHFYVQCAIKPGADNGCHTHWATESLDHLQWSKNGRIIWISLSRYQFNRWHLYGSQAAMALRVFHMRCCLKLMSTHILSGHYSISIWIWLDFSSLQ